MQSAQRRRRRFAGIVAVRLAGPREELSHAKLHCVGHHGRHRVRWHLVRVVQSARESAAADRSKLDQDGIDAMTRKAKNLPVTVVENFM